MYSQEHPYSICWCFTTVILTMQNKYNSRTPSAFGPPHPCWGHRDIALPRCWWSYLGVDKGMVHDGNKPCALWMAFTLFYTGFSGHWSKKWMTETLLTHVTFTNCPKRIAQRSTPMLHIPALSPKPPHTSKEVQRIQGVLVRSKEVYRRSLEKTIYKAQKKRPPVVSHHLLERSCWHLHLYIVNHLKHKKTKKLGVRLLWPKAPKIPKHAAKQLPNCPKSDMKSVRFNLLAYTGIHVHYCIHKYVNVYASILYMSKSHMSIIYNIHVYITYVYIM